MGDQNRISHEFSDGTLEKIMSDLDHGRIKENKSWSATHPAYYGTKIQQREIPRKPCESCSYFRRPGAGLKKICKFPWDNPKRYDEIIKKYLPCKGKNDEKNRTRAH